MIDSHTQAVAVLAFCGVMARDERGRITLIYTPARTKNEKSKRGPARFAAVTLARTSKGITMSCRHTAMNSDGDGGEACLALETGSICYHCRAALMLVGEDSKQEVTIHNRKQEAEKVAHAQRGQVVTIEAGLATKYAVFTKRATSTRLASPQVEDLEQVAREQAALMNAK